MDEATFHELTRSLEQAAAHARGETVAGVRVHVPHDIDVAAVRKASALSQDAFARRIGVAVGTLRNWEQRRRRPEGPPAFSSRFWRRTRASLRKHSAAEPTLAAYPSWTMEVPPAAQKSCIRPIFCRRGRPSPD